MLYTRAGQILFGSRSQAKNLEARPTTNEKIRLENILCII
jgi:hypothetical protein